MVLEDRCCVHGGEPFPSLSWQPPCAQAAAERVTALEAELRRAKRREEKLAALQFRLREDLRAGGGDLQCACLRNRRPLPACSLVAVIRGLLHADPLRHLQAAPCCMLQGAQDESWSAEACMQHAAATPDRTPPGGTSQ